jgi:hypothetical protein
MVFVTFGVTRLVIVLILPTLIVLVTALGEDVEIMVTMVVAFTVVVFGASVVVRIKINVLLATLGLVTGSGVIVRPTSFVKTCVNVEITSGDVTVTVAVPLIVLDLIISDPLTVRVSVSLMIVVETTGEGVAVMKTFVEAVAIERLLELLLETMELKVVDGVMELIDEDTVAHV